MSSETEHDGPQQAAGEAEVAERRPVVGADGADAAAKEAVGASETVAAASVGEAAAGAADAAGSVAEAPAGVADGAANGAGGSHEETRAEGAAGSAGRSEAAATDAGEGRGTAPEEAPAAEAKGAPASTSEGEDRGATAEADTASSEETSPDAKPEATAAPETEQVQVRYYGLTDVGLVREHNEDNFLVADLTETLRGLPEGVVRDCTVGKRGLVLSVCDGMGGAAAGEVASQMAVDTIYDVLSHGDAPSDRDDFARRLVHSVEEAGNRIFSASKMDRSRRGMGTTATVAGLMDKVLFLGQVGDSRAYLMRNGKFSLITKDQSLVNQLIEAGQLSEEEAEAFEHSNIILQALGTTEEVSVDLTFLELRQGDELLLCSDGLSGLVHGEMMSEVLSTTPDLPAAARRLIEMANAGGGHDNITIILARFDGPGLAPNDDAPQATYQQYPLPPADEEPEDTRPAREATIKTGGRKPGADVKRAPDRGMTPVRVGTHEGRAIRWWLIGLILVLVLVATALAFAIGGPSKGNDEGDEGGASSGAAADPQAGQEDVQPTVEVRVQTDLLAGQLFVDGKPYGDLGQGEEVVLALPPGVYKLEARSHGNTVATAMVTVRPGEPRAVPLMLPRGTAAAPGMEAPTPEAPAGGTNAVPPSNPELGDTQPQAGSMPLLARPNGPTPQGPNPQAATHGTTAAGGHTHAVHAAGGATHEGTVPSGTGGGSAHGAGPTGGHAATPHGGGAAPPAGGGATHPAGGSGTTHHPVGGAGAATPSGGGAAGGTTGGASAVHAGGGTTPPPNPF